MQGTEHWTKKGDVRLFLWRKGPSSGAPPRGTILFVHGSSMASQPTFDLHVPGRPESSVMEWFAARGFAGAVELGRTGQVGKAGQLRRIARNNFV